MAADSHPANPRALSVKQADKCEQAKEHVCKCRCGGALHGAKRGSGITFFNRLPANDPHYIQSKEAKAAAKRQRREEAWKQRMAYLGATRRTFDE